MFQKLLLSLSSFLSIFCFVHEAQLMAAAERPPVPLQSYGREIQSVAYSPDGHHILATIRVDKKDKKCSARMCSVSDGTTEAEFEGGDLAGFSAGHGKCWMPPQDIPGWANQGAFSPDGRRIAVGFESGIVRLFDAASEKILLNLFTKNNVRRIAFNPQNPNHLLVALKPDTARIINPHTGRFLFDLRHRVYDASYSQSGKRIAIAGKPKQVCLWDADSFSCLPQFECSSKPTSVSFSNDEKFIAAGDKGGRVYVFDVAANKILKQSQATEWKVNSVAFSPLHHYLITGSDDSATVWNTDSLAKLMILKSGEGQQRAVKSAVFSPDATSIATGSKNGSAILWDVSKTKLT